MNKNNEKLLSALHDLDLELTGATEKQKQARHLINLLYDKYFSGISEDVARMSKPHLEGAYSAIQCMLNLLIDILEMADAGFSYSDKLLENIFKISNGEEI